MKFGESSWFAHRMSMSQKITFPRCLCLDATLLKDNTSDRHFHQHIKIAMYVVSRRWKRLRSGLAPSYVWERHKSLMSLPAAQT